MTVSTWILRTSFFKILVLLLETWYLALHFLGLLSLSFTSVLYCKFQILHTLHFEYYNNNHYTFPYNQFVRDSALHCLRRWYRWCWYIFEFPGYSYTIGILSASLFKIFLLYLEIWYIALYFLCFISLILR